MRVGVRHDDLRERACLELCAAFDTNDAVDLRRIRGRARQCYVTVDPVDQHLHRLPDLALLALTLDENHGGASG